MCEWGFFMFRHEVMIFETLIWIHSGFKTPFEWMSVLCLNMKSWFSKHSSESTMDAEPPFVWMLLSMFRYDAMNFETLIWTHNGSTTKFCGCCFSMFKFRYEEKQSKYLSDPAMGPKPYLCGCCFSANPQRVQNPICVDGAFDHEVMILDSLSESAKDPKRNCVDVDFLRLRMKSWLSNHLTEWIQNPMCVHVVFHV